MAIFLLVLLHFTQIDAFSFNLESVGTKQVTVTPGNVITYNARITISDVSILRFYVNLPYFETPIFSIEKCEIIGVGSNLRTNKQTFEYDKAHSRNDLIRSQISLDFGVVGRLKSPRAAAFDDEIVIRVESRVMKHNNVTNHAVFWLYYGMEYQNQSVWVIGKSVKGDIQPGPARLAAKVSLPDRHVPSTAGGLKFLVEIYHLPDSRTKAIDVHLVLSVPSYLSYEGATGQTDMPTFTISGSGTTYKLELTEALEAGVALKVDVNMAINVADKGKFIHGHIHGDLQYKTEDEGCTKTVERKQSVQMSFKAYAHKDTCDSILSLTAADIKVSSIDLPDGKPEHAITPPGSKKGWRAWNLYAGTTKHILDNFLQVNFTKTTTITRLEMAGTETLRFVKSFFVSYSQDSIFWKHVFHLGKPKEFEANTDTVNIVTTLFQPEINAQYLRIHVKKYSANGPSMHIKLYGCEVDTEWDVPNYTAYQRGYLVDPNMLILCDVHPDRTRARTNCYSTTNDGLMWNAIDPRIVNVLGYIDDTSKIYGLGVSTSDTPVYMELDASSSSLRFITEADWTTIKSAAGITLPKVIPMEPASGNQFREISETVVTIAPNYYVATSDALMKVDEQGNRAVLASWLEYNDE